MQAVVGKELIPISVLWLPAVSREVGKFEELQCMKESAICIRILLKYFLPCLVLFGWSNDS